MAIAPQKQERTQGKTIPRRKPQVIAHSPPCHSEQSEESPRRPSKRAGGVGVLPHKPKPRKSQFAGPNHQQTPLHEGGCLEEGQGPPPNPIVTRHRKVRSLRFRSAERKLYIASLLFLFHAKHISRGWRTKDFGHLAFSLTGRHSRQSENGVLPIHRNPQFAM